MRLSYLPLAAGLLSLVLAGPARAERLRDYDPQAFARAQADGRRVMLIFSSRWSPVAQEQRPIIDHLARDMLYPDVVFMTVDAERHPELLRKFRVAPDTVVIFHGSQERARYGDTDEMQLRNLLNAAR